MRGSLKNKSDNLVSLFSDKADCECTALCLQDIGLTGPEGPPLLKSNLGDHPMYANFNHLNKARTVAIIIHKSWSVSKVYRDPTGSLVGVVASRCGVEILFVSAYLPAKLDRCGVPELWDMDQKSVKKDDVTATQEEAHAIYQSLLRWTSLHHEWLIGGDLNEVRDSMDRICVSEKKTKPLRKFINDFLDESYGLDVWRTFYPGKPGLTYQTDSGVSQSRIDYFLASPILIHSMHFVQMRIGDWNRKLKLDHAMISLSGFVPTSQKEALEENPGRFPNLDLPTSLSHKRRSVNLKLTRLSFFYFKKSEKSN
jgi:hypothetical protein